jgi:hypothetical protein
MLTAEEQLPENKVCLLVVSTVLLVLPPVTWIPFPFDIAKSLYECAWCIGLGSLQNIQYLFKGTKKTS